MVDARLAALDRAIQIALMLGGELRTEVVAVVATSSTGTRRELEGMDAERIASVGKVVDGNLVV